MKMNNKEVRHIPHAVEVRDDGSEEMVVEGYAIRFNSWSENLGGFKESIDKRALDNTSLDDVRALIDHDSSQVIGRSSNDTLKLNVDDEGLRFSLTLPNTTYARDLYENIRVGNVDNCSFGFTIPKGGDVIEYDKKENIRKRVVKVIDRLAEISVVSFPAYRDTDVSVAKRSIEQQDKIDERLNELKTDSRLIKLKYNL